VAGEAGAFTTGQDIIPPRIPQLSSPEELPPVAVRPMEDPDETLGPFIDNEVQDHITRYAGLYDTVEIIDALSRGEAVVAKDTIRAKGGKKVEPKTLVEHGTLELFRDIEAKATIQHKMTFSDDPWLEPYCKQSGQDELATAYRVRSLMQRQHKEGAFKTTFYDLRRTWLKFGWCIAKPTWESQSFLIERAEGWFNQTDFEGPRWKQVPLWRFHWTDDGNTIDKVSRVTEEIEITQEQILNLIDGVKKYAAQKDEEAVKANRAPGSHGIKWKDWTQTGRASGDAYLNSTAQKMRQKSGRTDTANPPYTAYLTWGIHPTLKSQTNPDRPDERCWYIISIRGLGWIAQMPNPYRHGKKPYLKACLYHEDETFTGWGDGTLAKLSIMAMNKRIALIDRSIALAVFGMYQRTGAPANKATEPIKVSPQATFDDVMDGVITPIRTNTDGITPAIQMNQMEANDIRYAIGAQPAAQGMATGKTAKESQIVAASAGGRAECGAEIFAEQMIDPALVMQDINNGQFLGPNYSFWWFDRMKQMTLQQFSGDYPAGRFLWIIKLALDIENRPRLIRQLTQTQAQRIQFLQLAQNAGPLAPLFFASTIPMYIQTDRKLAVMNGQDPDEMIDPGVARMIIQAINPAAAQTPMLANGAPPMDQRTLMGIAASAMGMPAAPAQPVAAGAAA